MRHSLKNAKNLNFVATRGRLSDLKIFPNGRGQITIASNSPNFEGLMRLEVDMDKDVSYDFNVKNGYNI